MKPALYLIFPSLPFQLVEYLDPDHKGFVTRGYIENLTVDQLKELLLFIDPNDVSNTEEFEYSHIDAPYIEWVIDGFVFVNPCIFI